MKHTHITAGQARQKVKAAAKSFLASGYPRWDPHSMLRPFKPCKKCFDTVLDILVAHAGEEWVKRDRTSGAVSVVIAMAEYLGFHKLAHSISKEDKSSWATYRDNSPEHFILLAYGAAGRPELVITHLAKAMQVMRPVK